MSNTRSQKNNPKEGASNKFMSKHPLIICKKGYFFRCSKFKNNFQYGINMVTGIRK